MSDHSQETTIIRNAVNGDQRAYRQLYELHVVPLYRFLRQFAVDDAETEEWVQRTFIKALMSLSSFRGQSKFSSWIIRIGINEMRMDKRKREADMPLNGTEEDIPEREQAFEWDQTMKQWLSGLSDQQKMVFSLYEVEGFSHAEIGEMLEIGESSSRTLLTRSKKYLRECWNKEIHS